MQASNLRTVNTNTNVYTERLEHKHMEESWRRLKTDPPKRRSRPPFNWCCIDVTAPAHLHEMCQHASVALSYEFPALTVPSAVATSLLSLPLITSSLLARSAVKVLIIRIQLVFDLTGRVKCRVWIRQYPPISNLSHMRVWIQ